MSECNEATTPTRALWQRTGLLPNSFTFIRAVVCFLPMWMILNPQEYPLSLVWVFTLPWWAATLIVLAMIAATDKVDGSLARRTNSVTKFGEKFDPVADKLLVIPTFVAICIMGLIVHPWGWIVFILSVIPEIVLVSLNIYLMIRRVDARIPSVWSGKAKMWVQCVGLLMAIAPVGGAWWQVAIITCFGAGIILSLIAANSYIRTGMQYLKAAQ